MTSFSALILNWFDCYGRKQLPWQINPTLYRVWVSEIMLQQTQVTTVIPYYERFIQQFPDLLSLANADIDRVLKHWQGLGYYSRARHLHKAAQQIRDQHQGIFPTTFAAVHALPGIGKSTAGAILSLGLDQPHAILDGNVKRVLARYHAVAGWGGDKKVSEQLWQYAQQHLPNTRNAAYTQAMMDMGATLCTRTKPLCLMCPIQAGCQAFKQGNPQDYPSKRVKKTLPEKQAYTVLVCNQQGEFLLTKRPPTGIWGGLWSVPEFADQQQALQWMITLGDQVEQKATIIQTQHTFSHYRLTLQHRVVNLPVPNTKVMEAESWLWYNQHKEFSGGLSSAVQQLLQQLKE